MKRKRKKCPYCGSARISRAQVKPHGDIAHWCRKCRRVLTIGGVKVNAVMRKEKR